MSNLKKLDFYDVTNGKPLDASTYGALNKSFKKVDNIDLIFSSRGEYLGIQTCRGKIINGKYTCKKGIKDFKSVEDLSIWDRGTCVPSNYVLSQDGNYSIQIGSPIHSEV